MSVKAIGKIYVLDVGIALLLNALLFQPVFQQAYPFFAYLDEVVVLFLLFLVPFSKEKYSEKISGDIRVFLLLTFVWVLIGLGGNYFSRIQIEPYPIIVDILTCVRFMLSLAACCVLFKGRKGALLLIEKEARFLLPVLCMLAFLNLFVDFGMGSFGDYGITRSFAFVFYHPGIVVWFVVALSSVLLYDPKRNMPYIVCACSVAFLTLTGKGIGWALCLTAALFLRNSHGRINKVSVLLVAVVAVAGALQSINTYYFNGEVLTARYVMLRDCFEVASEFAPFGSGFATFGSAITQDPEYYSSLYYCFQYEHVWGLSLSNPSYITDSFWPALIAQFGFLGIALFCLTCFFGFKFMRRIMIEGGSGASWMGCFSIGAYLAIGTMAETSVFNPSAVYMAAFLALLVGAYGVRGVQ